MGSLSCKDSGLTDNEDEDDESKRFITDTLNLASDYPKTGDKMDQGNGFFAMKNIEKESCQNSSKESSILDAQKQRERTSYPKEELEPGTRVWNSSKEDMSSQNLVDPDFL